ncbi:MAG: hypothetical protein OEM18_03255 [Nitrosopumilus sp.]|nr:hypothetical protein [Nitrosopumilus sp.]MDH3501938.1 hypothetical protein [Nitrosopumilus sp.]
MNSNSRKKSKKPQSREVTVNVDKIWELAVGTWSKIRSHQLTIKLDPI